MHNFTIDSTNSSAILEISNYLLNKLKDIYLSRRPIIFLCIGTDRCTGDSLGPLVGYKLNTIEDSNIFIYGSLTNPVHSKNLVYFLNKIHSQFDNPYIVAIDSCLGSIKDVGKIIIRNTPLKPGSALNKTLPQVGEISITGIVNISSSFDFVILQNTRLYTVMTIADSISGGIYDFIKKCTNISNIPTDTYK